MTLVVGSTRTEYCQDCEKQTIQRLEHIAKNGVGDHNARVWRCIDGDHRWGQHPGRPPRELEDLWDAS